MDKACNNPKCGVSTSMFMEQLTFGSGDLDEYGFWEYPCAICAREYERRHPEDGMCWPLREKQPLTREDMLTAEVLLLEDAKDHLQKCLKLLNSLTITMRERKASEDGSEPYRNEVSAYTNNEWFIERQTAYLIATALEQLGKIKVPEE